jgi:acyl-CoA thioester hydrolase
MPNAAMSCQPIGQRYSPYPNAQAILSGKQPTPISIPLRFPFLPLNPYIHAMADSTFRHPYRVTYADCTLANHIYYARYLNLLEAARGEFFRHIGKPLLELQNTGIIFPVIECRLRYRGAARYDDLLTIELWLTELARVRLTFEHRVLGPDGRELIEAFTMHACTTVDDKPRRLPEDLTAALGPYVHRSA